MSAFEVSTETINRIVSLSHGYISEHTSLTINTLTQSSQDADKLGCDLIQLNQAAVAHRYNDSTSIEPIDYEYPLKRYPIIECIKACDCWLYQCCEGDEFTKTDIYRKIEELRNDAANVYLTNLPEYKKRTMG